MNRQQNFDSMQISAHNRRGTQMFSLASKSLPWDDRNRLLDDPEATVRALLQVPGVHSVRTTIDTTWTATQSEDPDVKPKRSGSCTCGHHAIWHFAAPGFTSSCGASGSRVGREPCPCRKYTPAGADQ